jgi:hypothetical protein
MLVARRYAEHTRPDVGAALGRRRAFAVLCDFTANNAVKSVAFFRSFTGNWGVQSRVSSHDLTKLKLMRLYAAEIGH